MIRASATASKYKSSSEVDSAVNLEMEHVQSVTGPRSRSTKQDTEGMFWGTEVSMSEVNISISNTYSLFIWPLGLEMVFCREMRSVFEALCATEPPLCTKRISRRFTLTWFCHGVCTSSDDYRVTGPYGHSTRQDLCL